MRVAVLSDLHANRDALEAVAKDAAEQNVQEYWCLGDVVGYGAHPREVLRWAESHSRFIVKGNHDQAVATGELTWFNEVAAAAARFHAQLLDPDERARIYAWPLHVQHEVQGTRVMLVHASPDDPLREYVLPADAERGLARWQGQARIILLGHTHVPFVARLDRAGAAPLVGANGGAPQSATTRRGGASASGGGATSGARAAAAAAAAAAPSAQKDAAATSWHASGFAEIISQDDDGAAPLLVINPGSVGQPRDLDPRASYAVIDFEQHTVELRRVAYDVEAAAQAIQRAGLPTMLALRLYRGR